MASATEMRAGRASKMLTTLFWHSGIAKIEDPFEPKCDRFGSCPMTLRESLGNSDATRESGNCRHHKSCKFIVEMFIKKE